MSMSAAKYQGELNGLSSISRKVLEATPIAEEWSASQVLGELKRKGVAADVQKTEGCLASLVRSGLVREPKRGVFVRANIKPTTQKPSLVAIPAAQVQTSALAQSATPEEMPVDEFAAIAARVRGIAKMLTDAATEIENTALKVSDRIASSSEDMAKLKQLQKLLNELRS